MKNFLKFIISCIFLFSLTITAFIVRPYYRNTYEQISQHNQFEFEKYLTYVRLKIFYEKGLYYRISYDIEKGYFCHNSCNSFLINFYKLGIEHNSSDIISENIMNYLLNIQIEQKYFPLNNIGEQQVEELKSFLLTLPLSSQTTKNFICHYKSTDMVFINKLKTKTKLTSFECGDN